MRMTNNSGWTTGAPSFDIWLLSASVFASYSAGASEEVKPIEGWLTTRATIKSTDWTNIYIPTTATNDSHVFISIDNRPYGGNAPLPGSSVTVSWDDIQWVTGDAVRTFNGPCGTITINSGPGQAMYAQLGSGVSMIDVKATGVATPSARFAAYIFDQANLDLYLDNGNYSLNGTNGVICQNDTICKVANSGTWFFVLGCDGSGSVKYNYAFGASIGAPCVTTTTTTTTTTTISPSNTTTIISNTTATTSNGNSTTVTVTTTGGNTTATTIVNSDTTTTTLATSTTGGNSTSTSSSGSEDTTSDTDSASMLLLNAAMVAFSFLITLF
jgi:hypothetical protein